MNLTEKCGSNKQQLILCTCVPQNALVVYADCCFMEVSMRVGLNDFYIILMHVS